jgi:site-specific DNA-methyltransferase (adenine-specific)
MKPLYDLNNGKIKAEFYNDECLKILRALAPNSVDAVIIDPPYGLTEQLDIFQVMNDYLKGKDHQPDMKGFNGNKWDCAVPGPETFSEILRVLKPGGYLAAFCAKRTIDLLCLGLRCSGFQIRDLLMWIHCQGVSKSKAVHHQGMDIRADLIPKYEPIVLARKPILAPNFAENIMMFGTGGLNAKNLLKSGYTGDMIIDGTAAAIQSVGKLSGTAICPLLVDGQFDLHLKFSKPNESEKRLWLDSCGVDIWPPFNGRAEKSYVDEQPYAEYNFHPTRKPISLMAHLVQLLTLEKATVLDCYCGSGATAVAAVLNNRNFIGVDLNANFLKIAEHRTRLGLERFEKPQDSDFDYFVRFVSKEIIDIVEAELVNEIRKGSSDLVIHRKFKQLYTAKEKLDSKKAA